jgi:hypothetical protein
MPVLPKIPITLSVKPGGFRDQLKALNQAFSAGTISHTLKVPEQLAWWGFLEFGTAPYTIKAKLAKALHFDNHFALSVDHPGIRPRMIYRGVRDEFIEYLKTLRITASLMRDAGSEVNPDNAGPAEVMGFDDRADADTKVVLALVKAKELMAKRLETEAPGSRADGQLKGNRAADVWREEAYIE